MNDQPARCGSSHRQHILIVDDEDTLCEILRFNLESEGYEADTAASAEEALTLDLTRYDLVLLDIMMEGISGTQLAKILRANPATAAMPIIFCTACDGEEEMIRGLDLGADDYITKPYSVRNVIARIRSVLRRCHKREDRSDSGQLSYEGLVVIPDSKRCIVDGEEIRLPRKEFEILAMLLARIGRVFTREELVDAIWPDDVNVVDRVVDVNITRIRQKIGKYSKNIITRPGYGYGFME